MKSVEVTPDVELSSPSKIRKRDGDDTEPEDDHPSKRPRQALESFSSKPNLLLTDRGSPVKPTPSDSLLQLLPREKDRGSGSPQNADSPELEINEDLLISMNTAVVAPPTPAKDENPDKSTVTPPSVENVKATMPLHRARVANPLVKLLNDHQLANLKSHEANKLNGGTGAGEQTSPPKRRKPGPGRSSDGLLIPPPTLLTAEKGKLKSVRGKGKLGRVQKRANDETEDDVTKHQRDEIAEMTIDQQVHVEPPKPGELLQLAGLEPGPTTLPDYEDEDNVRIAFAQVAEPEQT